MNPPQKKESLKKEFKKRVQKKEGSKQRVQNKGFKKTKNETPQKEG
ncbi:hypothetical protein HPHPH18_1531 [Helicobacter pylori Hp H-18]|nr:hypothetical protein HPHPH18_1531 [Helicobacter pylori Hp H-18]